MFWFVNTGGTGGLVLLVQFTTLPSARSTRLLAEPPVDPTETATKSTALVGGAGSREEYPQVARVPSARKAMQGKPRSVDPAAAMATTFVAEAGIAAVSNSCGLFVIPQITTGETTSVTFVLKENPTELLTAAR
jgi:hypothetical protein